jgi:hypothetical protein
MSEENLEHRVEELKTHVVDKALFGPKNGNKYIVTVSWLDLHKAHLKPTYEAAMQFVSKYIVPEVVWPEVTDFAEIMPRAHMAHSYDNAFRLEVVKNQSRYQGYL